MHIINSIKKSKKRREVPNKGRKNTKGRARHPTPRPWFRYQEPCKTVAQNLYVYILPTQKASLFTTVPVHNSPKMQFIITKNTFQNIYSGPSAPNLRIKPDFDVSSNKFTLEDPDPHTEHDRIQTA
jgi:hypothetical protein